MSCRYYQDWQDEDGVWYPAGYYDSEDGDPCTPTYGGGGGVGNGGNSGSGLPNWVINQGGATGQSGTYSQTLQAILSGIALFQHQPYVPTSVQPAQQQPIYYPNNNNLNNPYGNTSIPRNNNVLGSFQTLLQQHPTAVLAGVVVIGALLLKPPIARAR